MRDVPLAVSDPADRYDHREGNDDYAQAGDLFRLLSDAGRERLIHNIVESMKSVPREIQARQIAHFTRADPAYGAGVAAGLGVVAVCAGAPSGSAGSTWPARWRTGRRR